VSVLFIIVWKTQSKYKKSSNTRTGDDEISNTRTGDDESFFYTILSFSLSYLYGVFRGGILGTIPLNIKLHLFPKSLLTSELFQMKNVAL